MFVLTSADNILIMSNFGWGHPKNGGTPPIFWMAKSLTTSGRDFTASQEKLQPDGKCLRPPRNFCKVERPSQEFTQLLYNTQIETRACQQWCCALKKVTTRLTRPAIHWKQLCRDYFKRCLFCLFWRLGALCHRIPTSFEKFRPRIGVSTI